MKDTIRHLAIFLALLPGDTAALRSSILETAVSKRNEDSRTEINNDNDQYHTSLIQRRAESDSFTDGLRAKTGETALLRLVEKRDDNGPASEAAKTPTGKCPYAAANVKRDAPMHIEGPASMSAASALAKREELAALAMGNPYPLAKRGSATEEISEKCPHSAQMHKRQQETSPATAGFVAEDMSKRDDAPPAETPSGKCPYNAQLIKREDTAPAETPSGKCPYNAQLIKREDTAAAETPSGKCPYNAQLIKREDTAPAETPSGKCPYNAQLIKREDTAAAETPSGKCPYNAQLIKREDTAAAETPSGKCPYNAQLIKREDTAAAETPSGKCPYNAQLIKRDDTAAAETPSGKCPYNAQLIKRDDTAAAETPSGKCPYNAQLIKRDYDYPDPTPPFAPQLNKRGEEGETRSGKCPYNAQLLKRTD